MVVVVAVVEDKVAKVIKVIKVVKVVKVKLSMTPLTLEKQIFESFSISITWNYHKCYKYSNHDQ